MILYMTNNQPKRLPPHCQPKRLNFLFLFLLLFLFPNPIYAVTTTIVQAPTSISNEPFSISVTITGAKVGKNYLRADIYKEGSTEYAGQTYNGQDWYSGEDGTKYAPIDIISSETQLATISARINTLPSNWSPSNTFFLRIRRYTASGSYTSSEAEASAIPIPITFPAPTPNPPPTSEPTSPTYPPTSTPTPPNTTSIDNIFISEALTAPESGQGEWVELFNNNDYPVTLHSWFIDDIQNAGSSPQSFTLTINAHSYATIDMQTSIFNNEGDSIRLLNDTGQQKDHITYSQTQQGKSISRNNFQSHETCITITSKNEPNTQCIPIITSIISTTSTSPTQTYSDSKNENENILGSNTELPTDLNQDPATIPITSFQGIGHDYKNIQPSDYQEEPLKSPQFQPTFFRRPIWTGLIRTGTASAASISILNIMFILYRMNLWRPHFRSKIFSFIGFPWSLG